MQDGRLCVQPKLNYPRSSVFDFANFNIGNVAPPKKPQSKVVGLFEIIELNPPRAFQHFAPMQHCKFVGVCANFVNVCVHESQV